MSGATIAAALVGGPADGRRLRVHGEARALLVPVQRIGVVGGPAFARYVASAERVGDARVFRHAPERST